MTIDDITTVSVIDYINQLSETQKKIKGYSLKFYKQQLIKTLGLPQLTGENFIKVSSSAKGIGDSLGMTPMNVVKKMADTFVTAMAIDDLIKFSKESGLGILRARVEDRLDEETGLYNGMYHSFLGKEVRNTELLIGHTKDICPFLDDKVSIDKELAARMAVLELFEAEYYDPLSANMSLIDEYHISE